MVSIVNLHVASRLGRLRGWIATSLPQVTLKINTEEGLR